MSAKENHKQLATFFTEEYHALKGYVQSRIDSTVESDAEDIIQDVALKLFSRSSSLTIENIAGFVYRSVRNKIIDVMRTKKENRYDESALEYLWEEFTELFYGPSDFEQAEQLQHNLKNAILKLKPAYRDIIMAVDFEGYSYREISEQTGIPPGTLMSQRHRAISILMKDLKTTL